MLVARRTCALVSLSARDTLRFTCRSRVWLVSHYPSICLWLLGALFGLAATFNLLPPTPLPIRLFGAVWSIGWAIFGCFEIRRLVLTYFSSTHLVLGKNSIIAEVSCLGRTWSHEYRTEQIGGFFAVPYRLGKSFDLYVHYNDAAKIVERSLSSVDVERAISCLDTILSTKAA